MKTEQPILITSILAPVNLSQNLFIGFDGNLPSADTKTLGMVNANTNSGNYAPVMVEGIALVKSSAAITKGVAVTTDSAGKAKAITTTEVINGYALDSASGADELIRILLK
jgi:hypothetical protein